MLLLPSLKDTQEGSFLSPLPPFPPSPLPSPKRKRKCNHVRKGDLAFFPPFDPNNLSSSSTSSRLDFHANLAFALHLRRQRCRRRVIVGRVSFLSPPSLVEFDGKELLAGAGPEGTFERIEYERGRRGRKVVGRKERRWRSELPELKASQTRRARRGKGIRGRGRMEIKHKKKNGLGIALARFSCVYDVSRLSFAFSFWTKKSNW